MVHCFSSETVHAKYQNGNFSNWLQYKSNKNIGSEWFSNTFTKYKLSQLGKSWYKSDEKNKVKTYPPAVHAQFWVFNGERGKTGIGLILLLPFICAFAACSLASVAYCRERFHASFEASGLVKLTGVLLLLLRNWENKCYRLPTKLLQILMMPNFHNQG